MWPFFGEHSRDLSFSRAMDARIGPARFPLIQVILRCLETFEAETFQRCLLRVPDSALDLSLPVRMPNPAWQGYRAVMPEHIAIQRIECGVVYIRGENAFAQIIEDNHASDTTEPAKGFLVQLCPCLRT